MCGCGCPVRSVVKRGLPEPVSSKLKVESEACCSLFSCRYVKCVGVLQRKSHPARVNCENDSCCTFRRGMRVSDVAACDVAGEATTRSS
jgi:hypothetical protein